MAEVLSPFTQPSSNITMLHSRPSSSSGAFQGSSGQSYQQAPRAGQTPRSIYNTQGGTPSYRGTAAAPVQPYAFQSTPHLRQETRMISAPATTNSQSSLSVSTAGSNRHGHVTSPSTSTVSSETSSSPSQREASKDDLFSGSRPGSFISLSSSIPDLSLGNFEPAPKASPERYRRGARRTDSSGAPNKAPASPAATSAAPSGSGMATVGHLYNPPPAIGTLSRTPSEDVQVTKSGSSESAKRYRRRSMGNLETQNLGAASTAPQAQRPSSQGSHGDKSTSLSTSSTIRPVSFHQRTSSSGSVEAARVSSITPPVSQDTVMPIGPSGVFTNLGPLLQPAAAAQPGRISPQPAQQVLKVPSRGSSDAHKRLTTPSPLSKSASPNDPQSPSENVEPVRQTLSPAQASSPAAQHLAALSDKDLNKGMKSRLRRAFSFGTTAELRRATENVPPRQKTPEEMEAEQDEIARKQEAAGIGAGIYSGQGGFTGSTDNLSISSTASSASMMLRKMGKGMKKSGRSLKGLFRPKSVTGVPAADGPVQPSLAQVSMVTVEAERQKVNVNIHPGEQVGGGTGFPKLERNSVDAAHVTDAIDRTDSMSRKSIVGSDKDRAEVLAAVKKGILKRSGTNSPSLSPDLRPLDGSRSASSQRTQSPSSSMPGTPKDERPSRSLTSTTGSNDYFSTRLVAKSMPNTPYGGTRNISFSPRIQFYDAWSSTDYDRRGDIATCNRLTPMLAQQIKEELNTFKMEMEVHELSKPHTHFF